MFTMALVRFNRARVLRRRMGRAARQDTETKVSDGASPDFPDAAVKAYIALDFSPNSAAAQALMRQASAEAADTEIGLSDIAGAGPHDLTPAMQDWYATQVAPRRQAALDTLSDFVLPLREGALDEKLLQDRLRLCETHGERFQPLNAKIRETRAQLMAARHRYETRKAELGREARVTSHTLYMGVLAAVLVGSGTALNLATFAAAPRATPAIAWGATIAIGLMIGLAAHTHGLVCRRHAWYFGSRWRRGLALVLGGATALSLALIFLCDAGVRPASLLGNLLVYLVGVLWVYLLHDADPGFAEARNLLRAREKFLAALRQMPERDLSRSLAQLQASHRLVVETARRSHAQMSAQPHVRQAQDLFARLQEQDDAVLALLLAYRERLIGTLPDPGRTRFVARSDTPNRRHDYITAADYQCRPIRLKYREG